MTSISKIFQTAFTTLAIIPLSLSLNLAAVRAESPTSSSGDITDITEQIARNPLAPATPLSLQNATEKEVSAEREESMAYVSKGLENQQAGNDDLALGNYYTAVEIDNTNGYAFLFAGQLIGKTDQETGIECAKTAAALFEAQDDSEGYELAIELLKSLGGNI
jgi:hypothetical protein